MPRKRKDHNNVTTTTITTTKETTIKPKDTAIKPKTAAKEKTIKPKKRTSQITNSFSSIDHEEKMEEKLLDNMIKLQRIHTDLAEKFDKLAKEISSLLALFELAAKSFSSHPATKVTETDKSFLDKIDRLLEQNKTIAKGLTMMEEQIRRKGHNEEQVKVQEHIEPVQAEYPLDSSAPPEYTPSIKTNRPLPRF